MPDPSAVRRVHRDLLERWRKAMDLVGPGPLEPHLDDADAVARLCTPTGRLADLGSGAGFPGVAFAARHPDVRVTLVESRQKRTSFLRVLIHDAGLTNTSVFHGRTEDLAPESFETVVSRAFAEPKAYLAEALRLLVPGGSAFLLLAREPAPDVEGLTRTEERRYEVDGKARRVVIYEKTPTPPTR